MSYSQEDLDRIIKDCCAELKNEQPILFLEKTNIHERTISVELSHKIRNRIKDFHVNCEYNRMVDEHDIQIPKRINLNQNNSVPTRVFPDIIIHRQEDGANNVLVVEIKLSWKNGLKKDDFLKLERYMDELHYKYGLYLELGEAGITEMIWLD